MKEIQIENKTVDLNKKIQVEISLHELLVLYCAFGRTAYPKIKESLEGYGHGGNIYCEDIDNKYFEELKAILLRHGVIK